MFTLLISEVFFDLLNASRANSFVAKIDDVLSTSAENTGGLIFLKYYFVIVDENFDGVLFLDVEDLTYLDGKNDSSECVDLTHNNV